MPMDDDSDHAGYATGEELHSFLARLPSAKVYSRPDIEARKELLANVIAAEILPRLIRHHQAPRPPSLSVEPPSREEVEEFGALAIGPDIKAALGYFRKMQAKGHSLDTLFLHLLEPAARYLGELWEQDRCDFIDVTIGVARLQELLTLFGSAIRAPLADLHYHALLISGPGERHLFGIDMVSKFMRNAGWSVTSGVRKDPVECAEMAARETFGVAGLTVSSHVDLEIAARIIAAIRKSSRNEAIGVMVGGPLFREDRSLALQIGADGAAIDAPSAVVLAKKLIVSGAIGKRGADARASGQNAGRNPRQ